MLAPVKVIQKKKPRTVIKMLVKEYRICMPITVEEVFIDDDV